MESTKNPQKQYICLLKKEFVHNIEYNAHPKNAGESLTTMDAADIFLGIMTAPDPTTAQVLIAKKYGMDWDCVRVIDCAKPESDILPKLILTNPYPSGADCSHFEVIMHGIITLGQLLDAIRNDRPCDKFGSIVLKYGAFGLNQESYHYDFAAGQTNEEIGIPNNALNEKIKSVGAVGGWGSMMYCVRLDTQKI